MPFLFTPLFIFPGDSGAIQSVTAVECWKRVYKFKASMSDQVEYQVSLHSGMTGKFFCKIGFC